MRPDDRPDSTRGTIVDKIQYAERYAAKEERDHTLAIQIYATIAEMIELEPMEYVQSSVAESFYVIYTPDETLRIKVYGNCRLDIRVPAEHYDLVQDALREAK